MRRCAPGHVAAVTTEFHRPLPGCHSCEQWPPPLKSTIRELEGEEVKEWRMYQLLSPVSISFSPEQGFAVLLQTPMLRLSVAKRWAVILWRQEWRGKRRVQSFLSPPSVYSPSVSVPGCSHPPPCACSVQPPSPQGLPQIGGTVAPLLRSMLASASIAFLGFVGKEPAALLSTTPWQKWGEAWAHSPHTQFWLYSGISETLNITSLLKRMSRRPESSRKHGQGPILYKGEEKY